MKTNLWIEIKEGIILVSQKKSGKFSNFLSRQGNSQINNSFNNNNNNNNNNHNHNFLIEAGNLQ